MPILVHGNACFNVDNVNDADALRDEGARELTQEEIAAAGMTGYEYLVSPRNTTVSDDGSILFTPPAGEAAVVRFARLRAERDRRIAATDFLLMQDYPIPEDQRVAVQTYRQALRDLPAQDGAPWDGGGEDTPWPEAPKGAA